MVNGSSGVHRRLERLVFTLKNEDELKSVVSLRATCPIYVRLLWWETALDGRHVSAWLPFCCLFGRALVDMHAASSEYHVMII